MDEGASKKEENGMRSLRPLKPLRGIVKRQWYSPASAPHGTGSVMLTLKCGHEVHCKQSKEPKRRARCYHCPDKEKDDGDG